MSRGNWRGVLVGVAIGALLIGSVPVVADVGDAILQGRSNTVHQRTTLRGKSAGATLQLINTRATGTGLSVFVREGNPPLRVSSSTKVDNLNADLLDGRSQSYFAPRQAQTGMTLVGAFGAAGDGTFLVHGATFATPLRTGIGQSKIHYVLPQAGTTSECPGSYQAASGHLCIYASWENNATYNGIGRVDSQLLNSGASRYGFTILWTGSSSTANVRGNWAYTVPAANDVLPEDPAAGGESTVTDIGILIAP